MAPLPKNWKPCKTKDTEDIYYFNFSTGESTWDHPCDGYYKRLYEEEKKKKETMKKVRKSSDTFPVNTRIFYAFFNYRKVTTCKGRKQRKQSKS